MGCCGSDRDYHVTSLYLRFHWATDLVAGAIAGGFVLRATIRADQSFRDRRPRETSGVASVDAPVHDVPDRVPAASAPASTNGPIDTHQTGWKGDPTGEDPGRRVIERERYQAGR